MSLVFTSCDDPFGNEAGGDGETPVRTVTWENDGNGYYQFSTNDADKLSMIFYATFSESAIAAGESVVVDVIKKSGSTAPGGLVFCRTKTETESKIAMAVIDYDGWFNILEDYGTGAGLNPIPQENTDWTESIIDTNGWVQSGAIKGLTETNTLEITALAAGASHDFELTINGVSQGVFSLTNNRTDGNSGFTAMTGTEASEDFPETPADLRFRMTSPLAVPLGTSALALSETVSGVSIETEYRRQIVGGYR